MMNEFIKVSGLTPISEEEFDAKKEARPMTWKEELLAGVTLEETDELRKARQTVLDSCTLEELYDWIVPENEYVLYPWLSEGESALISAKAGVGKTMLALSIASAIASGGSLFDGKWHAPAPHSVLYLDGEMRLKAMQKRCQKFQCHKSIYLFNNELRAEGLPPLNLFHPECRQAVINHIKEHHNKVLFIDNISSLYRTDKTNQMESWETMQMFVLQLRVMGVAVIMIDHEGKGLGGTPRGTSSKLDILDTYISLRKREAQSQKEGARFEIHFEKARSFYGKNAESFEAQLIEKENSYQWVASEIRDEPPMQKSVKTRVFQLLDQGLTPSEICNTLKEENTHIARSTCYLYQKEWQNKG